MIPKEVQPLEAILYRYGRCCQPDANAIDMTPSSPGYKQVENGEMTKKEFKLAQKHFLAAKEIAKLICGDCVVRPQCLQYNIHVKSTGISAGRAMALDKHYYPQKLAEEQLSEFVNRSVERFPTEPGKVLQIDHTPMENILGVTDNSTTNNALSIVKNS